MMGYVTTDFGVRDEKVETEDGVGAGEETGRK